MKFLLDSCVLKFAVNELQAAGMDVKWVPVDGYRIRVRLPGSAPVKLTATENWT
jgi:biotin operon repressor